ICSGETTTLVATSSGVIAPVFRWYTTATGGMPFHTGSSYTTSALTGDSTFYVSVSGDNYCEGTDANSRKSIEVSISCYTLRGTVFPFVYIEEEASEEFNKLFVVTASLYALPTAPNPFIELASSTPLHTDTLVLYDGSIHVPGTPLKPGTIGLTNNPGVPISWNMIGKSVGDIDDTEVSVGQKPNTNIGMYTLEGVPAGDYLLVISRAGYLTRYAKITVSGDGTLGHRELLCGDVNSDNFVTISDLSLLNANKYSYPSTSYNTRYDLDGNGIVDKNDKDLILFLLNASYLMYTDSYDWILNYNK
ncbi:hypothetical protein LJC16_03765, partial [Bacteroidales bacterium OttesenSCG-928-C19]|nr:hypothetical protein [Bacteroidales bacterium OttesenSCG-928-C19]